MYILYICKRLKTEPYFLINVQRVLQFTSPISSNLKIKFATQSLTYFGGPKTFLVKFWPLSHSKMGRGVYQQLHLLAEIW